MLISEIVNFMYKKKFSLRISPKILQKNEKHSFEVYGSLCGENFFWLIFIPLYWFDKNNCFKKFLFSSVFSPFKHGQKNKLSEYFSAHL